MHILIKIFPLVGKDQVPWTFKVLLQKLARVRVSCAGDVPEEKKLRQLRKSFTSCSPQGSPTGRSFGKLDKSHTLTGHTHCPVVVSGGILFCVDWVKYRKRNTGEG